LDYKPNRGGAGGGCFFSRYNLRHDQVSGHMMIIFKAFHSLSTAIHFRTVVFYLKKGVMSLSDEPIDGQMGHTT
jgi:hypothetical protein